MKIKEILTLLLFFGIYFDCYSVLNDFVENEEFEFDIVEKKEKGFLIENSEDYTSFIPFSYEKFIENNKKILLKIERIDLEKNQLIYD